MALKLYPLYQKKRAEGEIDLLTDTIKVSALDATYVYNAADEFYDDVSSALVGSAVTLGTKTVATGGVFDAADPVFPLISGAEVTQLVIWQDTGVAATSPLIMHIDTATGLPFTPSGANETVQWDAAGIFAG